MFLYKHGQFQIVVTVIVLGQRLGNDCLATPNAPGMAHVPKKTECVISLMLSIWCHCLLYLDSAWEMTVLPHPKAPGMAHVPVITESVSELLSLLLCLDSAWK